VEIDPAKTGLCFKKCDPITREGLRDLVRVLALPEKIEPGHHTCVLIETRAFGQSAERALNRTDARFQLQISQTLFIEASQREEAPIAASLQGEDTGSDEAGYRDNAAGCSGLREPRDVFELFNLCADHSSSSG